MEARVAGRLRYRRGLARPRGLARAATSRTQQLRDKRVSEESRRTGYRNFRADVRVFRDPVYLGRMWRVVRDREVWIHVDCERSAPKGESPNSAVGHRTCAFASFRSRRLLMAEWHSARAQTWCAWFGGLPSGGCVRSSRCARSRPCTYARRAPSASALISFSVPKLHRKESLVSRTRTGRSRRILNCPSRSPELPPRRLTRRLSSDKQEKIS